MHRLILWTEPKGWLSERRYLSARFFDVAFSDIVRAPAEVLRRIDAHFGSSPWFGRQQAVDTFSERRRADARGRHVYRAERYGIDREGVHRRFAEYLSRYRVLEGAEEVGPGTVSRPLVA